MSSDRARRTVAVVGSGVAGLTAAWALHRECDVTLYEADDRLGGHAHTHDRVGPGGDRVAVDSGFIVHNRRTYPTLLRLFAELDVATQESEMSMSVRCDECGLEYAGAKKAPGLFAQGARSLRPRYLRMLVEIKRFHPARQAARRRCSPMATSALHEDPRPRSPWASSSTVGTTRRYFRTHFMVPVVAAVWSTAPSEALAYPARYLFSFLDNHGMLTVTGSPTWRTVTGGSRYLRRAGGQGAHGGPHRVARRSPRSAGSRDHVEVTADGRTDVLRRRRRRDPPAPGAGPAGRPDADRDRTARRDLVHGEHDRAARRHLDPADRAECGGLLERADRRLRRRRGRGAGQLRHEPAAAARHGRPVRRQPQRRRAASTRRGCWPG